MACNFQVTKLDLFTLLLVLQDFGCKYVCCFMELELSADGLGQPEDAFALVMERSRELVLPAADDNMIT